MRRAILTFFLTVAGASPLVADELTHYGNFDNDTEFSDTSGSFVEEPDYTVSWSDLSTAGFADGDDVLVLYRWIAQGSTVSNLFEREIATGTTWAGRTPILTEASEPPSTSWTYGEQNVWFDRVTLTTNENFYFSHRQSDGTGQYSINNQIGILFIKLDDLTSSDFAYDEQTHIGNAPTAYDTSGASVSIPSDGDYLILASSEWLIDHASTDLFMAVSVAGTDYAEIEEEGEDTDEVYPRGVMHYGASLSSGNTVQARYKVSSNSHDCTRTAVFVLRLGAFVDSAGSRSTSTITHSVADTYQEFLGFPSYSASQTGGVAAFSWTVTESLSELKAPRARIQLDNVTWPLNQAQSGHYPDGAAEKMPYLQFGEGSVSSGARDWDFDVQERFDVSPNYDHVEHNAVVFSFELAAAAPPAPRRLTLIGIGP